MFSIATRYKKLAGDKMVGGFYIARAGSSVAFVPRVADSTNPFELSGTSMLRHEYAHHFMFSSFNTAFPMWFSESFAEYWSWTRFDKDGTTIVGAVPTHRVMGVVMTNPSP